MFDTSKLSCKKKRFEVGLSSPSFSSGYSDFKSYLLTQSLNKSAKAKKKVFYVAKKLDEEQLVAASKPSVSLPFIPSSLINPKTSNLPATRTDNEIGKSDENCHTFSQSSQLRSIFSSCNSPECSATGPLYNKDGTVIKRTIVGSPDLFESKEKKKSTLISKIGASGTKSPPAKAAQGQLQRQSSVSSHKSGELSASNQPHQQAQKSLVQKNRNQLLLELDLIKKRIQADREIRQRVIARLPLEDRLKYLQQEKCLEQYEQKQDAWFRFVEQSSQRLRRDISVPLILSGDSYRFKKESTDIFDYNKNDFEKYGSKVWLMTLRRSQQEGECDEAPQQLMVLGDIPDAFRNSQITHTRKNCEIIRRPFLTDLLHKKTSTDQSMYSVPSQQSKSFRCTSSSVIPSFIKEDEYYVRRLNEVKQEVKRLMPLQQQQVEFDSLCVSTPQPPAPLLRKADASASAPPLPAGLGGRAGEAAVQRASRPLPARRRCLLIKAICSASDHNALTHMANNCAFTQVMGQSQLQREAEVVNQMSPNDSFAYKLPEI